MWVGWRWESGVVRCAGCDACADLRWVTQLRLCCTVCDRSASRVYANVVPAPMHMNAMEADMQGRREWLVLKLCMRGNHRDTVQLMGA